MNSPNYLEQLRSRAKEVGNIVCVGLDPVLERIPLNGKDAQTIITRFYHDILHAMIEEDVIPACVKPNAAFYEQYGLAGLHALEAIIALCKEKGIPVILDGKRGDIGETSTAYARGWFGQWGVDAMTITPYMGADSVQPFLSYCNEGKGVYVLLRTSNPGAKDFQDLSINGKPLYWHVAKKLLLWHQQGMGVVVGATYPQELEQLSTFFVSSGKPVPFLIPGVGKQGGSASDVVAALKRSGNEIAIHRINSSSTINYAYEKEKTGDYAGAAVTALRALINDMGKLS